MFILLEGTSGVGKTLIAKKLAKKLNGYYFKEPPLKGPLSFIRKIINNYKIDPFAELFLLWAQRREIYQQIKNLLKNKNNIILERSYPSTIVYQYEIKKFKKVIKLKNLLEIDLWVRDFLEPDKIFVLSAPLKVIFKRIKIDSHKLETKKILKQSHFYYLKYSKKFNWTIIDTNKNPQLVLKEILEKI